MKSKKDEVFEKTRQILAKYEVTGISKNYLTTLLYEEKIASRMTVLGYLDEMADPKRGNIIELRVPEGKINKLCFPTKSNQILGKLKEKFKIVKSLIDCIGDDANGDLFGSLPDLKRYKIFRDSPTDMPQNTGFTSELFMEFIYPPTARNDPELAILLNSHTARKDFFQTIPLFLTMYLNLPKAQLSPQIKEECMKIVTPHIFESFRILNRDYFDSFIVSRGIKEKIQQTMSKKSVIVIQHVKGISVPDVEVEFLKILGRYSYSLNARFKGNPTLAAKKQELISQFITMFFAGYDVKSDTKLTADDLETIIRHNSYISMLKDKNNLFKAQYGLDLGSLALRFVKSFQSDKYEDDAFYIRKYYVELFNNLGIFSKVEQQILEYVLEKERAFLNSKQTGVKLSQDAREAVEELAGSYVVSDIDGKKILKKGHFQLKPDF